MNKHKIMFLFVFLLIGFMITNVSGAYAVNSCADSPLDVVNRNYELTQDISSNQNCIDITADGVLFELLNYKISHSGTSAGYGIRINADNVVVIGKFNGEISGSNDGTGIYFYSLNANSDITIIDIIITDGEFGIEFPEQEVTSNNITLEDIRISDVSGSGINGNTYMQNSTFKEIWINNSGTYGFYLNSAPSNDLLSYNKFKDIVITNTGSNRGFLVDSNYGNFTNINTDGFQLDGDYNVVRNIVSTYASNQNIKLISADYNQFNNFYSRGGDISLYLTASSHNQFVNGNLSGGDTYDINFVSSSSNNSFLDVNYDITKELITSGDLIRKWYFNAEARDSNGTAINIASVNVYNISSSEVLSVSTDSTGILTPYYENLTIVGEDVMTPGRTITYTPNMTFENQYVLGFSFLVKENNTVYNPWHGFPIETTLSTQNSTPIGDIWSKTWHCDTPWFSEYAWCGWTYDTPVIANGWVKYTLTRYNPNAYEKGTTLIRHAGSLTYRLGIGEDRNTLIEYINSAGSRTYQTPHTINVSKTGYFTNLTTYNLTLEQDIIHYVTLYDAIYNRTIIETIGLNIITNKVGNFFRDMLDTLGLTNIIERVKGFERKITEYIKLFTSEQLYNFADAFNSKAYFGNLSDTPPSDFVPAGETEFPNYVPLSLSDDDYVATSSSTNYPYHKFNMSLEGDDPEYVDFLWEGHTSSGENVTLYVWNYTSTKWSEVDNGTGTTDFTLTAKLYDLNNIRTGNGNVTFMVQVDAPAGGTILSRREYYDLSNRDGSWGVWGSTWRGQTFTVGNDGENTAFTISKITMNMYRENSPGIIWVMLRAVGDDGKPTGNNLSVGTYNGNSLTTNTAGETINITMSSYELQPSTNYGIILAAPTGADANNELRIGRDFSSPSYINASFYSLNGGSAWIVYAAIDLPFEVWGEA